MDESEAANMISGIRRWAGETKLATEIAAIPEVRSAFRRYRRMHDMIDMFDHEEALDDARENGDPADAWFGAVYAEWFARCPEVGQMSDFYTQVQLVTVAGNVEDYILAQAEAAKRPTGQKDHNP